MTHLSTKIGNVKFATPLMNASGVWCSTAQELEGVAESFAGGLITKSITVEPRSGNERTRVALNKISSVNSMGLPNYGLDYYCDIASHLKEYNKPLFASIAGFSESEFDELFEKVNKEPFDGIEINLSCPNVVGKCAFAYSIPLSLRVLQRLRKKTKKLLGVKLPPFDLRTKIEDMASGLVDSGVDFATLINSYPLGCMIDWKSEQFGIRPNGGVGGLGGEALKPIALGQVVLYRGFSKGKLPIIGVGGVEKGSDVYEFILAGASVVGIGTALWKEGPAVFQRIHRELEDIVRKKNIENLSDKIGSVTFPPVE